MEHESNACELPRVRFSDTVSTATDIIEAGTLGRLWFHLSLFSSMMTGMEELRSALRGTSCLGYAWGPSHKIVSSSDSPHAVQFNLGTFRVQRYVSFGGWRTFLPRDYL